jgi:hypothetical protein
MTVFNQVSIWFSVDYHFTDMTDECCDYEDYL